MSEQLKYSYKNIEITYNEGTSRFEFLLRGKSRSADNLINAKKAIDAPPPKDKKPFERRKCWIERGYGSHDMKEVIVTSIAESPSWAGTQAWVLEGKSRSKESVTRLYLMNDKNSALMKEIDRLIKEEAALAKEREKLHAKLDTLAAELKGVEIE